MGFVRHPDMIFSSQKFLSHQNEPAHEKSVPVKKHVVCKSYADPNDTMSLTQKLNVVSQSRSVSEFQNLMIMQRSDWQRLFERVALTRTPNNSLLL